MGGGRGARGQPSGPAMASADRMNLNSQLEFLQAKHVGTGHADTHRFEWFQNIHRDSYASFVGHGHVLRYMAVATNECSGRQEYELLQKMLAPVGPPPQVEDDDDL